MSKSIVVVDPNGKKYRLLMEGGLENVTVSKLKRYLSKSTGADTSAITLFYRDAEVRDESSGVDIGLVDGSILKMKVAANMVKKVHHVAEEEQSAGKETQSHRQMPTLRDTNQSNDRIVSSNALAQANTSGYLSHSPLPAPAPSAPTRLPMPAPKPKPSQQDYTSRAHNIDGEKATNSVLSAHSFLSRNLRTQSPPRAHYHSLDDAVYREPSVSISPQRRAASPQILTGTATDQHRREHDRTHHSLYDRYYSSVGAEENRLPHEPSVPHPLPPVSSAAAARSESMLHHASATTAQQGNERAGTQNHSISLDQEI